MGQNGGAILSSTFAIRVLGNISHLRRSQQSLSIDGCRFFFGACQLTSATPPFCGTVGGISQMADHLANQQHFVTLTFASSDAANTLGCIYTYPRSRENQPTIVLRLTPPWQHCGCRPSWPFIFPPKCNRNFAANTVAT